MDTTNCPLRPIRFLGLWSEGPWSMKAYGIAFAKPLPEEALITSARRLMRERLQTAPTANTSQVGFIGVHAGRTANFIFISWWANENELQQHVYVSPLDHPGAFEYQTPAGVVGCVWDLRVLGHERDAWLKHVLRNPRGPSIADYLTDTLSEDA